MQKLVQKHAEKIKLKLKLYEESLKSKETKRVYLSYFKKYMDYCSTSGNNKLILDDNPDAKKIEQSIIDLIILLKGEGKSYSAIHNYVSATLTFYKINDVVLNTDKIARYMPENRKSNKDRSYTHAEIGKLIEIADERMRAVILLSCSSGMRIGAIPALRMSNLEKIKIDSITSIYKITVYENDREEHFTYCTPECLKAIDQYLEMRKRYGEEITATSYLIRENFDLRDPDAISRPVRTHPHTLSNKIGELAVRCGIRGKVFLEQDEKEQHIGSSYRKSVPQLTVFASSLRLS